MQTHNLLINYSELNFYSIGSSIAFHSPLVGCKNINSPLLGTLVFLEITHAGNSGIFWSILLQSLLAPLQTHL